MVKRFVVSKALEARDRKNKQLRRPQEVAVAAASSTWETTYLCPSSSLSLGDHNAWQKSAE